MTKVCINCSEKIPDVCFFIFLDPNQRIFRHQLTIACNFQFFPHQDQIYYSMPPSINVSSEFINRRFDYCIDMIYPVVVGYINLDVRRNSRFNVVSVVK